MDFFQTSVKKIRACPFSKATGPGLVHETVQEPWCLLQIQCLNPFFKCREKYYKIKKGNQRLHVNLKFRENCKIYKTNLNGEATYYG